MNNPFEKKYQDAGISPIQDPSLATPPTPDSRYESPLPDQTAEINGVVAVSQKKQTIFGRRRYSKVVALLDNRSHVVSNYFPTDQSQKTVE